MSRPFFFHKKGLEFAAGLAWHPDGTRLLIFYGVANSQSWIATVAATEVRSALEDVEQLPSGILAREPGFDSLSFGVARSNQRNYRRDKNQR